jgi:Kef-type K+ transport system membrane component KefB
MTSFLQLAFLLSIILTAAKLGGYLAIRLGQPSVLGELLVGLLLGPSLIDVVHLPLISNTHTGEMIAEMAEIGVLLLMFLAGLELHIAELARNMRVSAYGGSLGVLIPVVLGSLAGFVSGLGINESIFLGLTMGATSVSISAQTLMELKVLRSRVGLGLLGAAVFDDVLVILFLSVFLAVVQGGASFLAILMVIGQMALFLVLSAGIGLWGLPWLAERVSKMHISQGAVTLAVVVMLAYGLAAELLGGMAAITGAFVAGLMFGRTPYRTVISGGMQSLAYAFFVPIFFVNIGFSINLGLLQVSTLWLALGISLLAVFGKILGGGLGARLGKFTWRESLQLGIGMVSRGEVGLIVAKVGVDAGLVSNELLSAIVAMVLVTTLVTPPMLRAAFSESSGSKKSGGDELVIDKEAA